MKPFCPECHRTLAPAATACPHCQNARPPFGWPRDPLLGELLDEGRLEIKARLGAGGFAVVYRATHLPSGQQRAVKVLGEQFGADAQMQTLFLKEAKVLSKLSHPHLVRYEAYGVLGPSRPWISMELVEGQSLRQEVAQGGVMEPARALALALQIAQALEVAHGQELLHRDLNPGNIMMVRGAQAPGCVKVIDFGLAKVLGRNTVDRRTNRIVGTPAYMAPEQFSPGTPLDGRLDLWQLGAVMHFMLTGHPPYPSTDHRGLLRLHHRWQQERKEHLPGPRPSHLHPALVRFGRVDDLISRLLSADVELRPASARDLMELLRQALEELAPQDDHTVPVLPPPEEDSPTAEQPISRAQQQARYCPRCQSSAPAPEAPRCAVCSLDRPAQGWPVDALSGRELSQGRYRILYRAGRGRLGTIYEASDLQEGRAVAVRLVEVPAAQDQVRALVTGRMQQLKGLHHPNLASVLDTGVLDPEQTPYVVMERARGTALHMHVWPPRHGFPRLLVPTQVMLYGVQLASAFARLHQLGWVHGGATPSNLLLMEHREAGAQIQLTGLGNAQLRQVVRGANAHIQLTDPRFAAPEQLVRGDVGDPRTDLYQLGAMLHFMLTGWPPFPRDEGNPKAAATVQEVLALQRAWEGELGPRPSRWIPALTGWPTLDRVVASLLHPRPEKRARQPLQVALKLSEALRRRDKKRGAGWENTQEFGALQATQEEDS